MEVHEVYRILQLLLGFLGLNITFMGFLWRILSKKADKSYVNELIEQIRNDLKDRPRTEKLNGVISDVTRHDRYFGEVFSKLDALSADISALKTDLIKDIAEIKVRLNYILKINGEYDKFLKSR